jgi:hypothetical protein
MVAGIVTSPRRTDYTPLIGGDFSDLAVARVNEEGSRCYQSIVNEAQG